MCLSPKLSCRRAASRRRIIPVPREDTGESVEDHQDSRGNRVSVRVNEEDEGWDEDEKEERCNLLEGRVCEDGVEIVAEGVVRQHLAQISRARRHGR